jgi:hypothetical protein
MDPAGGPPWQKGFHMRKALILWLVFDVGTDAAFWGWAAWQWLAG